MLAHGVVVISAPVRHPLVVLRLALGMAAVSVATSALAEQPPLSAEERNALLSEAVVKRPMEFERGPGSYIGGLSYRLVEAPPDEIFALLSSPEAMRHVLPKTRRVTVLELTKDTALVEMESGGSVISATFSVRLKWDPEARVVRFWMDSERPADIDDVYGSIRVRRFDATHSLVTVAAAVDLGGGLISMLFSDRIRNILLNTPQLVRNYVFDERERRGGGPPNTRAELAAGAAPEGRRRVLGVIAPR